MSHFHDKYIVMKVHEYQTLSYQNTKQMTMMFASM